MGWYMLIIIEIATQLKLPRSCFTFGVELLVAAHVRTCMDV